MKNKILAVSSLFVLASLSACRPAVVVAPNPHCHDEPVQVCHDFRDYRGIWHHECGVEYRQRCYDVAATLGAPVGPVGLGSEFGLSYDAADRVIDAAVGVNQGNLLEARNLGLSEQDLSHLAKYEMPTAQGIDSIAQTLDQSGEAIRNLFQKIMTESQKNDPGSIYQHH